MVDKFLFYKKWISLSRIWWLPVHSSIHFSYETATHHSSRLGVCPCQHYQSDLVKELFGTSWTVFLHGFSLWAWYEPCHKTVDWEVQKQGFQQFGRQSVHLLGWVMHLFFFHLQSLRWNHHRPVSKFTDWFKIIKNFPKRRDQRTKNFQEHTEAVFDNLRKLCQNFYR